MIKKSLIIMGCLILMIFPVYAEEKPLEPSSKEEPKIEEKKLKNEKENTNNETFKYPQNKVTGFSQIQFLLEQSDSIHNELKVYRARFGIKGDLNKDIGYKLIIGGLEPPDKNSHIVDAFVDLNYIPYAKIKIGQFLVPFGLEGPEIITVNPAIERSITIRQLNYFNMFRDIGIQISNKFDKFNYALAVVNGLGANPSKNKDYKDVLSRVGITPIEGLELGASAHWGKYISETTKDYLDRYRLGIDFEYLKDLFRLRGEFIWNSNSEINKYGWYILGGYKLFFLPELEVIARLEQYEPDIKIGNNNLDIVTLGLNYFFINNTRFSINYEFRNDNSGSKLGNLLTTQMQVAF